MLKIFTCNSFAGHWPVGTAAVVVAPDIELAAGMLKLHLQSIGLPQDSDFGSNSLVELDSSKPGVLVLMDGNY